MIQSREDYLETRIAEKEDIVVRLEHEIARKDRLVADIIIAIEGNSIVNVEPLLRLLRQI
jgi:hypothetical protein